MFAPVYLRPRTRPRRSIRGCCEAMLPLADAARSATHRAVTSTGAQRAGRSTRRAQQVGRSGRMPIRRRWSSPRRLGGEQPLRQGCGGDAQAGHASPISAHRASLRARARQGS
ncbi:MAG: hypothetical protein MZW92_29360 [Comamonadaceae bacterium]|nr:hypothetical protein [Comamonadaceae bacterium]